MTSLTRTRALRLLSCSIASGVAFALPTATESAPSRADEAVVAIVQATNPLPTARRSETIAILLTDLQKIAPLIDFAKLVVLDSNRREILSQLVDMNGDETPDEIVFQSDFAGAESKTFRVAVGGRTIPSHDKFRVYGRFVRERHDDFAWENDRIAHRVYGPDLETWAKEPLVSSGIDVWTKRVRRLIVNDWYQTDAYHEDHGDGADFYSVGTSRGCGGLGIYRDGKLAVSRNFAKSRVLANGPIRLIFELSYAPWDAAGLRVAESKRVTLDAGQNFDQFESTFTADAKSEGLMAGLGIAKHAGATISVDKSAGWMHSWEPLKSPNGNLGCAVVVPGGLADYKETDKDYLAVVPVPPTGTLRYWAGFGWDRSGDVADAVAWARLVERKQRETAAPIRIDLSPGATVGSDAPGKHEALHMVESIVARAPSVLTDRWEYDSGMVLLAIERFGRAAKNDAALSYVKRTIDGLLDGVGTIKGYKLDEYNIDAVNTGKVLFRLLANVQGGERERYRKAIELLRLQMKSHPRNADGSFWHKKIYPHQMWLDGVYMASPFLAEYAATFNEPALFDDIARQIILAEEHMRDAKTGLLYHGWDEQKSERWANPQTGCSSQFWGRAMGWYAMAIVDVLDWFPQDHPRRKAILGILARLASAITKVQDPSTGVWWQILDQPGRAGNYRESSASSMFVYALSKAVRRGWLDKDTYGPVASRGYQGLIKEFIEVTPSGRRELTNVCKVAGLGGTPYRDGSYAYYTRTEVVKNDPKGLGAFLLATIENE